MTSTYKFWVTKYSQLLKTELAHVSRVEKNSVSPGLNDVIIAPEILLDSPLSPGGHRTPNWVAFLNFCSLIESLILNDHVFLRLPEQTKDLIINGLAFDLVTRNLGLVPGDVEDFLQIAVGISETAGLSDKVYLHPKHMMDGLKTKLHEKFQSEPLFEDERQEWDAAVEHLGHERMATGLGCSYMSGFSRGGGHYQLILSRRTDTLKQLTPQIFYKLIKDSINTEVEELRTAGWTGDLPLPPLALLVLNKCGNDRKYLGEIVLEERRKAARFREWVGEIRSEFVNASNIRDASRLHKKLEKIFRDFAGGDASESWRTTSWNGLLAAFPKSIWDGLSKEDADIKSLASFLAQRPLSVIINLIRQRNYIYLLDVRNKVRRINEYAPLAEKVLSIRFSDDDMRFLKQTINSRTA